MARARTLDSKQPRPARSIAFRALMRDLRMDARAQMAVVQLAAIAASLGLLLMDGSLRGPGDLGFSIVIVVGFGVLRALTAGVPLAMSTLVLEPVGSVVLLTGTGGPASPFLPMALSGIWWAARSPRRPRIRPFRIVRGPGILRVAPGEEVEIGAKRPTWLVYGVSLAASYALLVGLPALRDGVAPEAFEDAIVLGAVWALAGLSVLAGGRHEADAIPAAPTRERVHLSGMESDLVACLALGMSNRQIADRLQVSPGTVRYRLTQLYRRLDVHGREEAVSRALRLGIELPADLPGSAPEVRS